MTMFFPECGGFKHIPPGVELVVWATAALACGLLVLIAGAHC